MGKSATSLFLATFFHFSSNFPLFSFQAGYYALMRCSYGVFIAPELSAEELSIIMKLCDDRPSLSVKHIIIENSVKKTFGFDFKTFFYAILHIVLPFLLVLKVLPDLM